MVGAGSPVRYDFPALSLMIRGCCRRERGRPMTADRNQAGYTDASGAHGAGLVVMWVRRGRPDSSEPAATGKTFMTGGTMMTPDDIDVWVGLDVGKSAHHAHALDHDGNTLYDKPVKQDEKVL